MKRLCSGRILSGTLVNPFVVSIVPLSIEVLFGRFVSFSLLSSTFVAAYRINNKMDSLHVECIPFDMIIGWWYLNKTHQGNFRPDPKNSFLLKTLFLSSSLFLVSLNNESHCIWQLCLVKMKKKLALKILILWYICLTIIHRRFYVSSK